jgi:hypothetical protein
MKRKLKLYVIYFPVILVGLQMLADLLCIVDRSLYNDWSFYLSTFLGTNVLFSVFMLFFVYWVPLCVISRWAAWAEVLFCVYYLFIQKDDLYNIVFQITVGSGAIIATFWHYIKRFPLCRMSLLMGFVWSILKHGSCKKGMVEWERELRNQIISNHVLSRHKL